MSKLERALSAIPRSFTEIRQSASHLAELRDIGWHRSIKAARPVDSAGNPIPWMCYPAIEILEAFVGPNTRVLEWGSGASTTWLGKRSTDVTSIEHNAEWFGQVSKFAPSHVQRHLVTFSGSEQFCDPLEPYLGIAADCGSSQRFDVVIVDGMARGSCMALARDILADGGVVVLDDSRRAETESWRSDMRSAGFREIKVSGVKPCAGQTCSTSFFVRFSAA